MKTRARLVVPEVVQTSNMDCGPAALKSLLEGFGIHVNYGRLREACQTDVDGTSIDTLESVANQLGLQAEQIMLPADHVLLEEARALPAIAVVVLPNGVTHFVIVWRRYGSFVQLMDPATGRRWTQRARFLSELYIHTMAVPAEDWREYAGSLDFLRPLRRRMVELGLAEQSHRLVASALADTSWRKLAALDAAVRMLASIVGSGAIERGPQAVGVLDSFLENDTTIPDHYWSVRPAPGDQLLLRGAVLVRALGPWPETAKQEHKPSSPELIAALEQPPARPGRELLRLLAADGAFTPAAMLTTMAVASAAVIFEAVLFRALLDLRRVLPFAPQRLGAIAAIVTFSLALLLLEVPLIRNLLRYGRRLETRLRLAFLSKLPRLGDRYFQSRLKSDMAERSHSIHLIRRLPELGGALMRYSFEIVFTTSGIIWLDPASAWIAILAAFAAVAIPIFSEPWLMERDLRFRTHTGALTHFYLDALLGLVAIRTHGAQSALRREHESLLSEWARAGLTLQRAVISLETLQFVVGFGLAIWLLASHLARTGETGAVLLLVYWALNLPALGQEVALLAWQYPAYRNVTLRLLEPLGAIEQAASSPTTVPEPRSSAASIKFDNVSVTVAGHTILRDFQLSIEPGEHVAIVGASGAGKSTLVGILLGWNRLSAGSVLVDGAELDAEGVELLRPHMAWVDPAVQLWNRPLKENLEYGLASEPRMPLDEAIDAAGLRRGLERLPDGAATALGEGGGLVSGGEGQRVRFGRALLRPGVRLVILDEAFRGLDLDQRRTLLQRAREFWRDATLLSISHDITETLAFERVLVLEEGRLLEDGDPRQLAENPESRFARMLAAEYQVREGLWSGGDWRRLRLEDGVLVQS
ncbi:MAG TPA: cysteine peptidase family C39 domain-containing protein [Bryobacteraceae bacterium]|nr:cysteine peptidase family C39 domain-containing protein [Bryobacteraceae bacterium]